MTKDTKDIRSEWSVADGPDTVVASGPCELAPIPASLNPPAPPSNHKLLAIRLHWPRVALALAVIVGCSLAADARVIRVHRKK